MAGKKVGKAKSKVGNVPARKDPGELLRVRSLNDLATVLEKIPVLINVSDLETHELLYVNKAVCDTYGAPAAGTTCHELFEGRKKPCGNCINGLIEKTRMPHTWDYRDTRTGRHHLSTAQVIRWHDGRDVRFETTIDITDQKLVETALQASEEKYRALIEKSRYGYFMLNTKLEVVYINKVTENIFLNNSQNSLRNNKVKLSDLMEGDEFKIATTNINKLKDGHEPETPREYKIRRQDGRTLVVEVQTFPIWKDGTLDGYQGTIVDITPRVEAQRKLKEKTEMLDAIFNNASDGIFVINEDLMYVMINPASGRILHHDPAAWIGKKAGTFKHPEDAKCAAEAVMRIVNGEPESSCEVRVQAADGRYHLLNIRYNPMFLGEEFHILGMVTDITESRKAETALKASEEKYRALFNQAADGVILMPVDATYLVVNQAFARMHGYRSPKEMEDLRLKDLDTPDSAKLAPERLRRLIAGEEMTFEVEHYHRDGHSFPVEVRCKVFNIDGIPHYMGFHQDITERKRAEKALIASEEKYRSLFENSPEAIIILGNDGRVIECNKATQGLMELSIKEILGRRMDELGILDSAQSESDSRLFIAMTEGKEMNIREMELFFRGGRSKWVEIIPSMIARAGEFYGVQIIVRDITDRKLADIDMRRKLLRFDIEYGNVYLSKETRAGQSLEAFKELLMVGNEGLMISRKSRAEYQGNIDYMFNHVRVSETAKGSNVKPDHKALRQLVSIVPRRHVIHIDCIEYLISRIGEKKTLAFVQYLKDLAEAKGLVVLMSVDRNAIAERELRLIEKECVEMRAGQSLTRISEKLLDILRFIDDMNKEDKRPSYSDISEQFAISKPTARKRIGQLSELGTVKEMPRGRMKVLELTKTGKNYLVV